MYVEILASLITLRTIYSQFHFLPNIDYILVSWDAMKYTMNIEQENN